MKRIIIASLLFLALGAGTSFGETFWVGSVSDGNTGAAANVMNFDWSSSGSGCVQRLVPAGDPLSVG